MTRLWYFPGKAKENYENMMASVPAKIRTKNIPNINLQL
jgi:hypothetical protein